MSTIKSWANSRQRPKYLDQYEDLILEWLAKHPDMSSAQVHDWLEMLNHAFEFFGGKPKTLVFDQDKIVAVSENYGDVIFTHEFEKYRQQMKFKVHLCHRTWHNKKDTGASISPRKAILATSIPNKELC